MKRTSSSGTSMLSSTFSGLFVSKAGIVVRGELRQMRVRTRATDQDEGTDRYSVIIVLVVTNPTAEPVLIRSVHASNRKGRAQLTGFEGDGLRIEAEGGVQEIQLDASVLTRQIERIFLVDDQGTEWPILRKDLKTMYKHYGAAVAEVDHHNAAEDFAGSAPV